MADTGNAQILPFTPQARDDDDSVVPDEVSGEARELQQELRMLEAILFATAEPVPEKVLAERLGEGVDIAPLMEELRELYSGRGVNLVRIGNNWAFRTADDLGFLLHKEAVEPRRLSRAALEVMATIAYHQPVTRAEVEEIRGVATSKGTLDVLMEAGWVRVAGRREVPGRPVIYATTPEFLSHFGLESRKDLPGIAELKASGLLDPVDDAYDGLMAERADAPDAGESEGSDSLGYDDPDEDGDEFEPGLASREESA